MSAASRIPLVGWLFPSPGEPGVAIARRTQLLLIVSLTVANAFGAAVVFVFLGLALPPPDMDDSTRLVITNLVITALYLAGGIIVGSAWGLRRLGRLREWLRSERPATEEERAIVLLAPYRIVGVHAVMWSGAAALFGAYNWSQSSELGERVVMTVLLGGVTTCAVAYLLTERMLRPAAARALAEGVGGQTHAPGVKARARLAWLLGTGIPLVGLVLVAVSTLVEGDFNVDELAVTTLVLAGIALVVGFFVTALAARAVADPVRGVREAVARVERGELDVEVPVYDGSELGLLQAGFNRMVAGLRERERIHDLFGRHVGEDVARAALDQEIELGGETRQVSVLFVDLVGSTELAGERPPHEVVEILNRFFGVVVSVVRDHGGWINKFEGDAALAIFGAPAPMDDHAGQALAAGRELCERVSGLDRAEAGIGVSSGEVVAGNIGEEQRFEYTVIGDPVNEAARLTELAKSEGGVLASQAAVEAAAREEADRWEVGEPVKLRGRQTETRLAKPRR